MGFRSWTTAHLQRFLTAPIDHYELRAPNDFGLLERSIRKGDVLLIEGDQRVSAVIKYLTQSSWSHAGLYIGDELLRRGGDAAERAAQRFGDGARHLLVEALLDGVVVSPLTKYVDYNVRLCRPRSLRAEHVGAILDDAIAAIGWRYDVRNILDLAVHLVLMSFLPGRARREVLRLGSGTATEVICTSLIGSLFQKVGFPVLPRVSYPAGSGEPPPSRLHGVVRLMRRERVLHRGVFEQRHPTLLTPRDFDLSPYFEIVNFHLAGRFDYQRIQWARSDTEGEVA